MILVFAVADYVAKLTGGFWSDTAVPTEPTLSVVNDGDGDAVTATVDGDAGVTNTLYYRKAGDAGWTAGNNRVGDGAIAQAGLDDGISYEFVCISVLGGSSLPSNIVRVYVTSGSTKILNIISVIDVQERTREMELLCEESD